MPAVSRAQQQAMAIAEHSPDKLNPSNKGMLDMSHQQLHDFASTPTTGLPKRKMYGDEGGHWMAGAVKRPGALTKKANSAGDSPMSFARKHYHSGGLTGQQARFAVNAQK